MKKTLIFFFTFLVFFLPLAFSLEVNITPDPGETNATTQNVTINFTINNTGTTNIIYVEVLVPEDFNLHAADSDFGNLTFEDTTIGKIIWDNISIEAGDAKHCWITLDIPSVTGIVNFTFFLKDDSNTNETKKVSVEVKDVTPPVILETEVLPQNNTEYKPNNYYNFSVVAKDNIDIDSVIFSLNGSTVTANYSSGTYEVLIRDLPVGCYQYSWFINDTSNNTVSNVNTYCIQKSANPISIFFNDVKNSNYTIEVNESLNITVFAVGKINVTLNSTPFGNLTATNVYKYLNKTFTETGCYIFKAYASGNENYTSNYTQDFCVRVIYHRLKFTKMVQPDEETYSPGKVYTFKVTIKSPDYPLNNITNVSFIWKGNSNYFYVTNSSESTYTHSVKDLKAGSYSWKWCAHDSQNEIVCTEGTLKVKKATPSLKLWGIGDYAEGSEVNIVGLGCPEQLVCNLYRNGTLLDKTYEYFNATSPGEIIYIFNTTGNENYTSFEVRGVVKIFTIPQKNESSEGQNLTNQSTPSNSAPLSQTSNKTIENEMVEIEILKNLEPQKTTSVLIKSPYLSRIEKIEVKPKKNIEELVLKIKPSSLPQSIPPISGKVYTYLQIESNVSDELIESVKIEFKVSKSWMSDEKVDKSSIRLYRFSNGWKELPTKIINETSEYVYYQAISPGFSYYAIIAKPKKRLPFAWIIAAIAITIIIAFLFWPTEETEYKKIKEKWSFRVLF